MKAKKIIMKFVVIPLVILVVVLVLAFIIAGDAAIKKGIEVAGSKTLGVPVTVKSIHLSLLKGRVGIEGLVVKNPPGYANETLLELGEGVVKLDVGSLFGDPIKIELVKLDGTKLTIEQKGLTNNLKEILNKLPKEEEQAKPEEKGQGKNLNIAKLEITNTTVKVKLIPLPGKIDTIPMNIDTITMTDLGTDKKLKLGTLIAKVLGAMAAGIAKQGVGILPDDMVKGIGSAVGTTVEAGKAVIEGGQKALEKTTDVGKGVVDGFKGLLGGKKEEPNK